MKKIEFAKIHPRITKSTKSFLVKEATRLDCTINQMVGIMIEFFRNNVKR